MFGRSLFLFLPAVLAVARADGLNDDLHPKSLGTWNGTASIAASSVAAGWDTGDPGHAAAFVPVGSVHVIVHSLRCPLLTRQRISLSARATSA